MKYIITESSLHKLTKLYLDSLNIEVVSDSHEIFVYDEGDELSGLFNYVYSENELSIDPFIISSISGMFNMDRGQSMESIAMWFEDKFDIAVMSAREWDW